MVAAVVKGWSGTVPSGVPGGTKRQSSAAPQSIRSQPISEKTVMNPSETVMLSGEVLEGRRSMVSHPPPREPDTSCTP